MLDSKLIIKTNQGLMEDMESNINCANQTIVDMSKTQHEAYEYSKEINNQSYQQMLKNK